MTLLRNNLYANNAGWSMSVTDRFPHIISYVRHICGKHGSAYLPVQTMLQV